MNNVIVSICIITYKHEKFIRETIDSVLMQKTSFDYELIISNDCSPDNTDAIIEKYLKDHPDGSRIKYFSHKKNIGMAANFVFALQSCKGKYIALCEGDDYWTNENKLQKQVDFLEVNQNCSGCFHDAINVDLEGHIIKEQYHTPTQNFYNQKEALTLLRSGNATCSLMFRANVLNDMPNWFKKSACDFTLDLLITEHGLLAYMKENMAAYRIHSGGIFQGTTSLSHLKMSLNRFLALEQDKTLNDRYGAYFNNFIRSSYFSIVLNYTNAKGRLNRLKYGFLWLLRSDKAKLITYKIFITHILFPGLYKKIKSTTS